MNIPMVSSKEKEFDKSNQNKTNEQKVITNKEENINKTPTTSVNVPASSSNNVSLLKSNNNLSSSISSMLTPDLLNNIDLQGNLMNMKNSNLNNITPPSTNIQLGNKNPINRNPLRDAKGGSGNRISLSSLDKRLASESIDYEPVFK
jgi:hypothetical protein